MEEKIREIAKYIINNQAAVQDVANKFNLSVRTIQIYINKKLIGIDPDLYCQVKNTQKIVEALGKVNGGKNGIKTPSWLKEDAVRLASKLIDEKLSLRELSKQTNIPSSTLFDMFKYGITDTTLQNNLQSIYEYNKTEGKRKWI